MRPREGDGRRNRPYHPAMMMKVLLYGYAVRVYSSRKVAVGLERDAEFRWGLVRFLAPILHEQCEMGPFFDSER